MSIDPYGRVYMSVYWGVVGAVGKDSPTGVSPLPLSLFPPLTTPPPMNQVLNTLQMWAKSADRMTYLDVKARMGGIDKDKTLR